MKMSAFEKLKEIFSLPNETEKHKAWLEDYKNQYYSQAVDGIDTIKWKKDKEKYKYTAFSPQINKIQQLPNRLIIDFDDKKPGTENKDIEKINKNIQILKERCHLEKWGFIHSSHNGNGDYIWIEFSRNLTDKEKKAFLKWIAPPESEIDLNMASSNFRHPVMFALHWKHSNNRELPIEFFEGNKIDFDTLNIPITSAQRITKSINENGFEYYTFKKAAKKSFSIDGQTENFAKIQPLFYDKTGMFWLWDDCHSKWEKVDDIDVLNMIQDATKEDTVNSKNRNEILNSLKQLGRRKIPKPVKQTWIQFKDKIVDISTGEEIKASPEYFITNPIPWELNKENFENTPNMDKIFEEWVGKDYVKTLYEILAYCLLPDYPIHRIFCFVGSGLNGKGCFLRLLKKFIGETNCCSTELDTLISSRFEVTRLYKKLVCQMGETNFEEFSRTSLLKKLTGGDLIGFEHKGKTPFEGDNYAKIIISTNNLPATTDKTIGFYRRWMIIDFPVQFSEAKDILKDIPDEEYSCLALKCCSILKEILKKRAFTNEGSIEERMERYESKSNFLDKFLNLFIDSSDPNGFITKSEFHKRFAAWSKENRHRELSEIAVSKALKDRNIASGNKYFDWIYDGKGGQARVWEGIKWKV